MEILFVVFILALIVIAWKVGRRPGPKPKDKYVPPSVPYKASEPLPDVTYIDEKGRTRCSECEKLVYLSEGNANYASERAERRGTYLRPYYEEDCGYWHLTSQEPRGYW